MDSAIRAGSVSPEVLRNGGFEDDNSDTTLQLGYFVVLCAPMLMNFTELHRESKRENTQVYQVWE